MLEHLKVREFLFFQIINKLMKACGLKEKVLNLFMGSIFLDLLQEFSILINKLQKKE